MTAEEARQIGRGDLVRYRGREYTVLAVVPQGTAPPALRLSGLSVREGGTTPVSSAQCTLVARRAAWEAQRTTP